MLVDAAGLSDPDRDGLPECTTQENAMAVFDMQTLQEGLIFDLGKPQPLESVLIWNYNKPAYTDYGAAKAALSVWTEKTGWKTVLKEVKLLEAEGSDDYDEPTVVSFEPVVAQKVRFDKIAGFNPQAGKAGLGKIRFYSPLGPAACNPEPAPGAAVVFAPQTGLRWTAGKESLVHAVYLGEDAADLKLQGRITGAPYVEVEGLKPETQYVWRIDEIRKDGTVTQGPLWSFATLHAAAGSWSFEENVDDTHGRCSGIVQGAPQYVDGPFGKALRFDGKADGIEIPPLNVQTGSATICGWLRIPHANPNRAGIFMCRSSRSASGLNFMDGPTLGYHWADASNTWQWDSEIEIPFDQWVFAALVVSPSKAVIYVWDGHEMKTAVNEVNHRTETFSAPVLIGRDPHEEQRRFIGDMDEVRFYTCALTEDQIKSLCGGQLPVFASDVKLVNAELVTEDQSLAQIAMQTRDQEPAASKRRMNFTSVLIILAAVVGLVFVTTLKKKN